MSGCSAIHRTMATNGCREQVLGRLSMGVTWLDV